jgi:hypothetical protein
MTRQSEHYQTALDFVKASRYPQSIFEFAADLENVGMRGGKIPVARAHVWKAVIDQLVTEGKLRQTPDGVCAVDGDEGKAKQLSLF